MDSKTGHSEDESTHTKTSKQSNILPLWGNERTMNLNPLILTNIQSSHYFKVNLYELKTYHEVIDEIYYKVSHLEPWEKGSRRTSGQTGMCGGVRGVGAGGIVSTAYCLLYKLFTLKLTRKQLNGLISHCDSPFIRALGFMYIRYTFPPANLLEWYEDYLEDEEELDVKAGGGQTMTIGLMLRQWLVKLEWFSTLFPRIPVPIQQKIQKHLESRFPPHAVQAASERARQDRSNYDRDNRGTSNNRDRDQRPPRDDLRRDFLRDDNRRLDRDPRFDRRDRGGDFERRDRDRKLKDRSPVRQRSPPRHKSYSRDRSPHRSHRHRDDEGRGRRHY
ncbi:pre-mRNA-splicing factor 38B [Leptinotarsa decemlineata]|uniref:pre-mRNA-splicing factor 38B n=1 Tax=Leptinotarsa decemlineata TaxID=7539 RepID=UPI000C251D04|nr:pre-mRNA-splicing factor 38B [Leptinotarsa decemlineata]